MAYHPDSNYHTAHFKPFRVLFHLFSYVGRPVLPESLLYASECLENAT